MRPSDFSRVRRHGPVLNVTRRFEDSCLPYASARYQGEPEELAPTSGISASIRAAGLVSINISIEFNRDVEV